MESFTADLSVRCWGEWELGAPLFAAFSWVRRRGGGLLRKGLGPEERRAEGETSGVGTGGRGTRCVYSLRPLVPSMACGTKLPTGTAPASGELSASAWLAYREARAKPLSLGYFLLWEMKRGLW